MTPFSDFTFFGLILYPLVVTLVLGFFGRANAVWATVATAGVLCVLLYDDTRAVRLHPGWEVRQLWLVLAYAAYQGVIAGALLQWRSRWTFYAAVALSILPLATGKVLPTLSPESTFGFLGLSYVTFRALDVIFSIHDKVITSLRPAQYFTFVFFFPTISSGPIDRYRRFTQDWSRKRDRTAFLDDLDVAVQRVFQGFLYKFILAALIKTYWLDAIPGGYTPLNLLNYMYAWTAYLFFDFAGYSAFAIGFSRLLGFRTPENFDRPFLSRNIRDFWNRWHISLSFWFRDHIYMRFLLTAAKAKWFKGKHTASYIGLFLTFGIMGVWHGLELHYILYGIYHAVLLCGYDWFQRWNKARKVWPDGPGWRVFNVALTLHAVAFGLLLFSGKITPHAPPPFEEVAEKVSCEGVSGWAWDRNHPQGGLHIDIYADWAFIARVPANLVRPELTDRGLGSGQHGFTWPLPDWLRDGNVHRIEARVAETNRPLRGTPEDIVCRN